MSKYQKGTGTDGRKQWDDALLMIDALAMKRTGKSIPKIATELEVPLGTFKPKWNQYRKKAIRMSPDDEMKGWAMLESGWKKAKGLDTPPLVKEIVPPVETVRSTEDTLGLLDRARRDALEVVAGFMRPGATISEDDRERLSTARELIKPDLKRASEIEDQTGSILASMPDRELAERTIGSALQLLKRDQLIVVLRQYVGKMGYDLVPRTETNK